MTASAGIVYLVGAGPGDPGLLTRRGAQVLARAEVLVYDGLVHPGLVDLAPAGCERIYAGKKRASDGGPLTQAQINDLLVELGRAGKRVVRLKGGDPFVFGRGAEECVALRAAGIPFEVVPGVTSATAVTAYAGIPLTARDRASTVAFATGHESAGKPASQVDWAGLARASTVVLFMAVHTAGECCAELVRAGRAPQTPAAAIYRGTTAAQRTVVATLADLPEAIERAGLKPPALLVVGEVVALREQLSWFERRPLFGARIWLTRAPERADELALALTELGADAVAVPLTRIAPAPDPHPLRRGLAHLADYAWVLFTSANAVSAAFSELEAQGRDARAFAGTRLACVGPGTAAALAGHGLRADLVPERADGVGLAEALAAACEGGLAGVRVLFPQAENGRPEAIERVRAAGAELDVVVAYRSEPVDAADVPAGRLLRRLRDGDIDVVAFFAPSQVRAFFDRAGADAAALLAACRLVAAIGATTAEALTRRGVTVHVVPTRPTADALATALAATYPTLPKGTT